VSPTGYGPEPIALSRDLPETLFRFVLIFSCLCDQFRLGLRCKHAELFKVGVSATYNHLLA